MPIPPEIKRKLGLTKGYLFEEGNTVQPDIPAVAAHRGKRGKTFGLGRWLIRIDLLEDHDHLYDCPFCLPARKTPWKRIPFEDLTQTFEVVGH